MEKDRGHVLTQAEQNLLLLERMIPSTEKLYISCYGSKGKLIASSCPKELTPVLEEIFLRLGGRDRALSYAEGNEKNRPFLIGSSVGMHWSLSFEAERNHKLMFVTGPVFYVPLSEEQLRTSLRALPFCKENLDLGNTLCEHLSDFPVMSYAIFLRYVVMIHNTLTGQQLGLDAPMSGEISGIQMQEQGRRHVDRNKVYQAERALLEMVRRGDIGYQVAFQNSLTLSSGVPLQGVDPLRKAKTNVTVFATLICRAAMEGGLSPEIAYSLSDSYIQAAEDCHDSGELSSLNYTMYHDFVYRVHHLHSNPAYSPAIQKCCDYIDMSLDRKIRTKELASLAGYTEYYLTDKFKKETGITVSTYIRNAKVERAKVLLKTSDLTIQEIADRLAFGTVGYFIKCFRDVSGITPAQYRKQLSGIQKEEKKY